MTNTSDKTIAGKIDTSDEACVQALDLVAYLLMDNYSARKRVNDLIRALCAERDEAVAKHDDAQNLIKQLMQNDTSAYDVVDILALCGELGGKRRDEKPAQYLRRLIDGLIHAESELSSLRAKGCGVPEEAAVEKDSNGVISVALNWMYSFQDEEMSASEHAELQKGIERLEAAKHWRIPDGWAGELPGHIPAIIDLPAITERGVEGQIMDVAWPEFGGDQAGPDFWYAFSAAVSLSVRALLQSAPQDAKLAAPMEGEVAELVRELRTRKCFFRNGAHWMMSTLDDDDCQRAANALESLSRRNTAALNWQPIDHRPLTTGRYIVAHRGYAEIIHFLSPTDRTWQPHTKIGWQRDPSEFNADFCAMLPDTPDCAQPPPETAKEVTTTLDMSEPDAGSWEEVKAKLGLNDPAPPHPAQSSGGSKDAAYWERKAGVWMNGFADMAIHRDALAKALRRLVVCARTSGGVAGRDDGLCKACDDAEAALTKAPATGVPSPPEPSDAAVEALKKALEPFAKFADPTGAFSDSFKITAGSGMARRQLTMGHCYRAKEALAAYAVDRRAR